ncbi:MAG: glycosyltransferase [Fervidobacterium sp.]|jgi:glycosyltransferase involved in cell wall biosynthesis
MNDSELLSKISELISQRKYSEAKVLAEKIENEVDKQNVMGIIYYYEQDFDEAIKKFEGALKIDPIHADVLFNYAKVLFERGKYFESWRYLARIHDKTWEVYDLLGDTQLKQDNPAMALHYYKKAFEISNISELKEKYNTLKSKYKKNEKLAIFCFPGLDNFVHDIADVLSNIYDIKLVVSTDGREITQAYQWADIVWLEWANEMAIEITNKLPKTGKKVICRLHSYESLTDFPEKINWNNVDKLILVSEPIGEILKRYHTKVYEKIKSKIIIISNGVDLNKFKFSPRNHGYNIAIVANISYKKDPATWLQVIGKLKKLDERYTIHIAGSFQDLRYENYFRYFIKDANLEDNVKLYGFLKDINTFLEDKNYVLSTSIHESFGYNIAEAMASGIKSIIHNFEGSKQLWPADMIFDFIDEIPKIISEDYNSERYRSFIEERYSLEEQIKKIVLLLSSF